MFPRSFYEDLREELGLQPGISFPELVSRFEAHHGERRELLVRIKERIEYLTRFPELYRKATAFHRELSTIPHLDVIFTTNWDDLFERECGATPIVTADDFVFSDIPGRKVFKLHGSVTSYGSIIASSEDYERMDRVLREALLGANLKVSLATHTFLFAGYSFQDADFQHVLRSLQAEMGRGIPRSYAAVIDEEAGRRFAEAGIVPIAADATRLLAALKRTLVADDLMIDDGWGAHVHQLGEEAQRIKHQIASAFPLEEFPQALYPTLYLDGVQHACEFMAAMAKTGRFTCPACLNRHIRSYEKSRGKYLKRRMYDAAAYVEGYSKGLLAVFLRKQDMRHFPLYFVVGATRPLNTPLQFARALKRAGTLHPPSYTAAANQVAQFGAGAIPRALHHLPFLSD